MKISVIIPHFNSLRKLKRLLETIPEDENIEVIVIDDRSKHEEKPTRAVLKKNIQLLSNESGLKGAGTCRNIGLSNAKGDFVIFADSDDYFTPEAFNIIQTLGIRDNTDIPDILFFKPTSVSELSGELSDRHLKYEALIDDYKKGSMDIRYGFYVPWSKVYRLKFLIENDINFDEVIASNDVMFSLKAGYLARDIEISDEIIYTVTRGRGSLTVNKSIEVLSSRYEVELRRIDYINENEIDFTTNSLVGLLLGYRKIGTVRVLKRFTCMFNARMYNYFP